MTPSLHAHRWHRHTDERQTPSPISNPPRFRGKPTALKLLRLAVRNITSTRGGDMGTGTWGWKQALNAFEIYFPGRLGLT